MPEGRGAFKAHLVGGGVLHGVDGALVFATEGEALAHPVTLGRVEERLLRDLAAERPQPTRDSSGRRAWRWRAPSRRAA